jgi:hypothetical protein
MELEGFSTSLIGRSLYVYAGPEESWIPYEFISGTQYSCKVLIRGAAMSVAEAENEWTVVFRPTCPRDWSIIATIIRSSIGSVLLAFDAVKPPESFITFLDTTVSTSRTLVTRIWIGVGIEIPCIPDAIFFPPITLAQQTVVCDVLGRLPARSGHGPWRKLSAADWTSLCQATIASGLGMVVSDVEESEWSLYWHKVADSATTSGLKQGLALVRAGATILEKYSNQ